MSVWATIRSVLESGKDPVVTLTYEMLKLPERKKPGRPKRVRPEPSEAEKLASTLLRNSARPVCINPHCSNRLKAKQKLVCCEGCRSIALIYYQSVVDLLAGSAEEPIDEVPNVPHYDPAGRILLPFGDGGGETVEAIRSRFESAGARLATGRAGRTKRRVRRKAR